MTELAPKTAAAWPPIISNAALPRAVLWRDRIATVAMWLLLLWLFRAALHRLWGAPWLAVWNDPLHFATRLGRFIHSHPYFDTIGLLVAWQTAWTMVTLWRRQRYGQLPQPPALRLEEEARRIQGIAADLSDWRKLKICIAHLDSEGQVSVLPKMDP